MSDTAFVLRQRPFKNTSQIVELFTREHGRVSVVARGVSRPKSTWSGILRPFIPLQVDFLGKSELKTLTNAEATDTAYHLTGLEIYCGFYINELLLYLLHKEEPHPLTFDRYAKLLEQLCVTKSSPLHLRQFEYQLLCEIGFGFDLSHDKHGEKITDNKRYIFNHGLALTDKINATSGRCLQYLTDSNSDLKDADCQALHRLMRARIDEALDGKKLKSRDLLKDYLRVQQ